MADKKETESALVTESGVIGNDALEDIKNSLNRSYKVGMERREDKIGMHFNDKDVFWQPEGRAPRLLYKMGASLSNEELAMKEWALEEFAELNKLADKFKKENDMPTKMKEPVRDRSKVMFKG